jgi:hypothetical protein
MRGRGPRGWWPLWAIAVIVVAVGWLLYVVWQSPHRSDLATYGAFALPVVVLAAGWVTWAWRRARTNPADSAADGENLDRAADRLATAVQAQWAQAAGERGLAGVDPIRVTWGRPSLPLAGPLAAAVGSRRFDPLPGLAPVGEAGLAAGQISDLHAVYGGLGSGRLVIAGPPGSGKSGAAVLLVLAALQHRQQVPAPDKPKVPVPVLVTAQDWDPQRQSVADWLTRRLQETYPLFTGAVGAATAATLIAEGKIAVILDGLDEIAAGLRPVALQALSQQARFRVVVLSRTAEMASAASRCGVLQGAAAIELRAIGPAEATCYLERVQLDPPPDGWRDLIDRIRTDPASPLSSTLDSPLTLTLVRDIYRSGDDARELLEFCDTTLQGVPAPRASADITDHLLDRVLPTAYAHRPGQPPPPYDLPTAQNALTKIAARMNQDGARDLEWWRIPAWAQAAQRYLVVGLAGGLVGGLVGGLLVGPVHGLVHGLEVGLVAGLVGVLLYGLAASPTSQRGSSPHRMSRMWLRKALNSENLVVGLVVGLVGGLVVGLVGGLVDGLVYGLVVGLVGGLLGGLMDMLAADPDSTSSLSPAVSWHDDRRFGLVVGLVGGLGAALVAGLVGGLVAGLGGGLGAALVGGLVGGLGAGLGASRAWSVSLTAAQLAIKWRTPAHLMRFLDDACDRNVLRTVGPVYQFRHARLQDRLAYQANTVLAPVPDQTADVTAK